MNTQSDADEPQGRKHGGGARKDDALLDDPRAVGWLEDYTKLVRALTDAEAENRLLREVLKDFMRDFDARAGTFPRDQLFPHIRAARRALGMVKPS